MSNRTVKYSANNRHDIR